MSSGNQLPLNDPAQCIAAMKAGQEELATLVEGTFQDVEALCAALVQRGIPALMSLVAAQQQSWSHSTAHTPTA